MTHGHFDMGYSETVNIFKVRFWEGVTKKSTLCTLVKMMTILDDPLEGNDLDIYMYKATTCTSNA